MDHHPCRGNDLFCRRALFASIGAGSDRLRRHSRGKTTPHVRVLSTVVGSSSARSDFDSMKPRRQELRTNKQITASALADRAESYYVAASRDARGGFQPPRERYQSRRALSGMYLNGSQKSLRHAQVTETRQTLECRGSRGEARRQTGLALSPSQRSALHRAARQTTAILRTGD